MMWNSYTCKIWPEKDAVYSCNYQTISKYVIMILIQLGIMIVKPMWIAMCLVSASICDRVAMVIYRIRNLEYIYIYPDQRIKWFDVICRWWFDYIYIYGVVCIFGVPNFNRNRLAMISIRITNVIIAIRGVREWAERLWKERIISSTTMVFHVGFLDFDYCIIIIHLFHRTGLISEMSSSRMIHACIDIILASITICEY